MHNSLHMAAWHLSFGKAFQDITHRAFQSITSSMSTYWASYCITQLQDMVFRTHDVYITSNNSVSSISNETLDRLINV
jgi:hypothetical protein